MKNPRVGGPPSESSSADPAAASPQPARWTWASMLLGSFYAACVVGSLLVYGLWQERIMSQPYEGDIFTFSVFLVFFTRIVGLAFALVMVAGTCEPVYCQAPLWKYVVVSVPTVVASICQFEALRYVSFTMQILGKSSKTGLLMLGARAFVGTRWALSGWGGALNTAAPHSPLPCDGLGARQSLQMAPTAGTALRVIGYNPMWASGLRMQEILHHTTNYDAVLLCGTQTVCRKSEGVLRSRVAGRTILEAVHQPGPFTTAATGCAVILRTGYNDRHIRQTWSPPRQLAGRGLAVRIQKGAIDITYGVLYYPPQPRSHQENGVCHETAKALTRWWRSVLLALPCRTLPLFYSDVNDGIGAQVKAGGWSLDRAPVRGYWKHALHFDDHEQMSAQDAGDWYKIVDWMVAFGVTAGLVLYSGRGRTRALPFCHPHMLTGPLGTEHAAGSPLLGLGLLGSFVVLDGVSSFVQDKLFSEERGTKYNQLLYNSVTAALLSLGILLLWGRARESLEFCKGHPALYVDASIMSAAAMIAQWFVHMQVTSAVSPSRPRSI
ncbi:unnamed protein product [Prorocentrum cordatum]|uniref:Uncharacterized protein n=1 Tax=Prorocentrum cordatum TaxID=2364126 RepID=A0ABN9TRD9_9DINO|nr:unnamed protein product [Polarella glacialis]